MTIADVDTMYWCVIRPKVSSVPRQQESPEDGFGRRLTSETASAVYSLTIPRIAVPADGHRDPVRQLKTVRRPPIYPNGAQAISPAAPSPPFRCPHAVHRWIRAKDTLNNPSARLNFLCVELQGIDANYASGLSRLHSHIRYHNHRRESARLLPPHNCIAAHSPVSHRAILLVQLCVTSAGLVS